MSLAPDDPRHGTVTGYNNHGCRCDLCREAGVNYQRERCRKPCVRGCGRIAWHRDGRPGVCAKCSALERRTASHGTEAMYKRCHCDECRAAASAGRRERRRKAAA